MAVMTPPVFPLLFLHSFLQLRLENNLDTFKSNLKLYTIFVIALFVVLSLTFTYNKEVTYLLLDYSIYYIALFPIVVTLLIGVTIWEIFKNSCVLMQYRYLLVLFLSLHLLFCSFSNTGPLMGMSIAEVKYFTTLRALVPFSIGLLLPFLTLVIILRYFSRNHRQSKAWKLIQIIGLLWFIILLFKEYFIYL